MKHRLLLLLLFVFTAVMTGWAQNSAMPSYTVKGVLLDSLTQDGEPYATIKITKKGAPDKAVKMAVTGANGRFQETECRCGRLRHYYFFDRQGARHERVHFETIG